MCATTVTGVAVGEGAYKRHLVGYLGHLGEDTAQFDPRDIRLNGADDAAIFSRGRHLRIERLDVGGAATKP